MISLSEEVRIASPPDTMWPLLRDPALVASCIPGAALTAADEGGGAYQGTMQVRFGPTRAIFRGQAKLAYDDAERRCTIEGRGIDGRGASRALASGVVTASGVMTADGAETTILKVEGKFNVTGPLETFANAGGVHLARALLAEFAGNMARLAAQRTPPAAEVTPHPRIGSGSASAADADPALFPPGEERAAVSGASPPPRPPAAAELHGGALIWRAFLGWFKQLFFAKGKAR
jgi:carbon monoxide dehydrogenase subunit G